MKHIEIQTADNQILTATEFAPETPNQKVVLINSALAIKQRFYYDFATMLCKAGYHVYTYDYRSIGLSKRTQSLKGDKTLWRDWAQKDFTAVANFLNERHQGQKMFLIGNSYGGNCLGMSQSSRYFSAFITVGSQHGYWRLFWASKQPTLFLLWYVLIPVLANLYGYLPSKMLGLGEALPKGVALEWAKVCRDKDWLFPYISESENFYPSIYQPILAISVEDDFYAPQKAVDKLHFEIYQNAKIERKHILLAEVGGEAVGHFGFFRKKFQDTFGKITLDWLAKQV
jgi:predicted alpha/beta hydrolase